MIDKVENLGLIPDFDNSLVIQLIEDGKVIQEEKLHNFVSKQAKLNGEYIYKSSIIKGAGGSMPPTSVGLQYSQINLWDNTSSFEENLYMLQDNGAVNATGYCTNWSTDISGDSKKGSWLSSQTINAGGSTTYVWEWATSQANGAIKAVGFTPASDSTFSEAGHALAHSNIPAISGLTTPMYIGCRTSGGDRVAYFRGFGTYTNNVIGIKVSDFSLVETLSLNINGGILNNVSGAVEDGNTYGSKSYNDTVLCNDFFYTVTAVDNGTITIKKADKATLTYGAPTAIPFSYPAGFTYMYQNQLQCVASDGDRYAYFAVTANKSGGPSYSNILLKLDCTTDTITSIDWSGVLNYTSQYTSMSSIAISPSDANTIFVSNGSPQNWASSIGKYNLTTGTTINISAPLGLPSLVLVDSNLTPLYKFLLAQGNTFYVNYSRNPSVLTYAELSNPITKTSSQSLRVQYTLQAF